MVCQVRKLRLRIYHWHKAHIIMYSFFFNYIFLIFLRSFVEYNWNTVAYLRISGQHDNNTIVLDRYEDEFHELNYYNGRGASSRELYDSQHSRIAPLASRLLGLSFPTPPLSRACEQRRHRTRRHHPYIMHGLMLFLFNDLRVVYTSVGPIYETLNPRASFFTEI